MPDFRPLRVFLCCAKEDKPMVRDLYWFYPVNSSDYFGFRCARSP
jgi:hypothetical protein